MNHLADLPPYVTVDSVPVYNKSEMLNHFNEHFIASGFLFDSSPGTGSSPPPSSPPSLSNVSRDASCSLSGRSPFLFSPFAVGDVWKALRELDPRKSSGPDNLPPLFLRLAADIIASSTLNEIPEVWKTAFVLPLLKGGDPKNLNNYRPISKFSILAKVLERLVNDQIKDFLGSHNILSPLQSGFRKRHSTVSAAVKVVNDILEALDKKFHCAALFVDLSKAFDIVDHSILCQRLSAIGFSSNAVGWFANYLSNRKQSVLVGELSSSMVKVSNGVPQGSVLGLTLFTIYINNIGSILNASVHLYADDTILYCCASSVSHAFQSLQSAFDVFQSQLRQLKLVLNAEKTKVMLFSNSKCVPDALHSIVSLQGTPIELVSNYKYLGIHIDDGLSFKIHVDNLLKKLKMKLSFFFRNKSCFSFAAWKRLVAATFLPHLDYGDVLYMYAPASCLQLLDAAYRGTLRFITGCKPLTHHCVLYSLVNWSSLHALNLSLVRFNLQIHPWFVAFLFNYLFFT
ncbi:hypothetical protein GJAV_G00048920 [Gymnothorax javanicus]|nr:hypothetical protein GJAV_G00048920 [Gymnothorax javanicus]